MGLWYKLLVVPIYLWLQFIDLYFDACKKCLKLWLENVDVVRWQIWRLWKRKFLVDYIKTTLLIWDHLCESLLRPTLQPISYLSMTLFELCQIRDITPNLKFLEKVILSTLFSQYNSIIPTYSNAWIYSARSWGCQLV